MNRYSYIIKREVTYTEELHTQIVAKTEQEAENIANEVAEGRTLWPGVDRYNVAERDLTSYDLISLEKVRG